MSEEIKGIKITIKPIQQKIAEHLAPDETILRSGNHIQVFCSAKRIPTLLPLLKNQFPEFDIKESTPEELAENTPIKSLAKSLFQKKGAE